MVQQREYEPWDRPRLVLETVGRSVASTLAELLPKWEAPSSLSDLSKNRDFLEYYVSRSLGNIVELRSDRYSF